MKKLFLFLTLSVFIFACGNSNQEGAEGTDGNDTAAVNNEEMVVMSAAEIHENAAEYVDKQVMVEGTIVHVCAHGGKRMFLLVNDTADTRFKVTAGEGVGAFKTEDEGETVVVSGIMKELKVDEDYLNNWEKEIKEQSGDEHHIHDGKHGEDESHDDHDMNEELAKLEAMRQQLKESQKDHLSFYSLESTSFEKK